MAKYTPKDVMKHMRNNYELGRDPNTQAYYDFTDTAMKIFKKFKEYLADDRIGGCYLESFKFAEKQGWITRKVSIQQPQPVIQAQVPLENRVEAPAQLSLDFTARTHNTPEGYFPEIVPQSMEEYRKEKDERMFRDN